MIGAKIEHILNVTFKPDYLEVIDESYKHAGHAGASQGGHYRITVISKSFRGKKLLEVHRMIYRALEAVKPSIHALSIKAGAA
ncbi:MAG: BolA family transcriptional regulator [Candidatus Omnitrophica bacterium]|nr:BolA family transcriptional regulator [Candidatus Omnitrophota bacterium]MDE2009012.1 BolA family transcriptional regulator [Candidatus Omnitrophota bacterium]MDE2214536.1 BolA family transcriptional regulator [Candidatus Omnitrophota bacterium]MDE2230854.1 BolA family transcriptional regulator [Candidatus Omnitrophota bacterium]